MSINKPVGRVKTVGGYPDESEHTVEWLCKYKDLKDGDLLYVTSQPTEQKPQLPLPDFIPDPDDSDEGASLWDHGFKQGWNSCLEVIAEDMQHTEVTAESLVPLSDYQKLQDKCDVLVKDLELLLRRLEKMPRKLWLKEQLETILTTLALEDKE